MRWANRHIQSCEATRIENIWISRTLNRQEFRIFSQRNIRNGKMLSEQYMTMVEYFTDGWHSFHRALCVMHIHSNNELDARYEPSTKSRISRTFPFLSHFLDEYPKPYFDYYLPFGVFFSFKMLCSIRLLQLLFAFLNLAPIPNNHVHC